MAIKRGVSFYSYQQEQFLGKMDWKDMIREVHDNLKTDGVEIIDGATVRDYPFPSEEFVYAWRNEMARYQMKAVTMDVFLEPFQFRDHVMNYYEAAERLKNDIRLAHRLGFENVRTLCMVPIDVIEMALPTAEKYNVRIGKEIHAPFPIKPGKTKNAGRSLAGLNLRMVDEIVELADRTGSKHVGLVPDFGVFQFAVPSVQVAYEKRQARIPESIDFIMEHCEEYGTDDMMKLLDEKYPGHALARIVVDHLCVCEPSAKPEDLKEIIPYIISVHGKFFHMSEIPGKPGQYEECAIAYEEPMKILREGGYDGYIDSEYEGQRYQQDDGLENLADEIEQVRRHHEMLARLSEE